MRISDWSSDVCSSDLLERGDAHLRHFRIGHQPQLMAASRRNRASRQNGEDENQRDRAFHRRHSLATSFDDSQQGGLPGWPGPRRPSRYIIDGRRTGSSSEEGGVGKAGGEMVRRGGGQNQKNKK